MKNRVLNSLCGILACTPFMHSHAGESQPNIIFILVDDFRYDALGYCGNGVVSTPTLDSLAKQGVFFRNAFSTTPISSASRASILTGLYERTHRYSFRTGPLDESFLKNAYPLKLKEAGYKTALFGKLGVVCMDSESLFDEIEDYDRNTNIKENGYWYKTLEKDTVHLTRYTGQQGLDYIEKQDGDKPFFLSLCFSAPHAHDSSANQYFWDEEQENLYDGLTIPDPKMSSDEYFDRLPEFVKSGFSRLRWTWRFDTPEKYQYMMKGYYRMISGIDMEIAKIRQLLKKKGLDENTVIVFMGDNGYILGERQLADKWLMYDLSVRVPLIIYDPREKRHVEVEEQVLNIDIPSTLVNLAQGRVSPVWQGKSLVDFLQDNPMSLNRDTILIEHLWEMPSIPSCEGIRTSKWKYFRYINDKRVEELYDLEKDPDESVDLAKHKKYASLLKDLRAKTDELILRFSAQGWSAPSLLRVDYIRKPEWTSVQSENPVFSWQIPSFAQSQRGYQILVSSSRKNIECNVADIWDSGFVGSSNTISVLYAGKPLQKGKTYFWRVRCWDYLNRTSEYSVIQEFSISPLSGETETIVTSNPILIRKDFLTTVKSLVVDDAYQFDFGKAAFATLGIEGKSKKDMNVKVRVGEQLNAETGRIETQPGGTIRYQELRVKIKAGQSLHQILFEPDERNTGARAIPVADSIGVILPFRYVELYDFPGDINELKLYRNVPHGYSESLGHFKSSHALLNDIWDICKYTIEATDLFGYYIDGDRERIPYEADAYINQLSHYAVDAEYGIAKKTLEYFMKHPTWPTEWLLHTPMMAYQDYYYTGDKRLIEKYYEQLKVKTLYELAREDGLISSLSSKVTDDYMRRLGFSDSSMRIKDIVDWPKARFTEGGQEMGERDGYEMKAYNTVVNCFFYHAMTLMAELAEVVGKDGDSMYFSSMALKVKCTINAKLFDAKKGIYVDGEGSNHSSLHSNMFPLAFGMVPKERMKSVVDFVKSRGMACSVYGAQYLFEALYKAGEEKYALELMTDKSDRSWYNMLRTGSTMTLEAWDIKYKGNLDWNHAWGAAPANLISRMMWGITPVEAGFKRAVIKPQLADLEHSEIVVPTIRGNIMASYEKRKHKVIYTFNVPANMGVDLVLPDNQEGIVLFNDEAMPLNHRCLQLKTGQNHIEIQNNTF